MIIIKQTVMNVDLRKFRKDFQAAVAQLEKDYNVSIDAGTIRYNDTEFRFKVIATIGGKQPTYRSPGSSITKGDTVGIKHPKVPTSKTFTVVKVNRVKYKLRDNTTGALVNADKSLVFKK